MDFAFRFRRWTVALNDSMHVVASAAVFALSLLILADVGGRYLFNRPIAGVAEIAANSIVAIAFLQISQAINKGGVLRASLLDDFLPDAVRRALLVLGRLMGALLFVLLAYATFEPMMHAWQSGEYAGIEGVFTFAVWPVRVIIFVCSLLAALNYLLVALFGQNGEQGAVA